MMFYIAIADGKVYGISDTRNGAVYDFNRSRFGLKKVSPVVETVDLDTAKRLSKSAEPPAWPEAGIGRG